MQFTYDGEIYKVFRITGPSHNLLGISFGNTGTVTAKIEPLRINGDKNESIHESNVQEQVLSGINEINDELGTDYKVKRIQFISSDTPSKNIYKELSKELVRQIERKGEFKLIK